MNFLPLFQELHREPHSSHAATRFSEKQQPKILKSWAGRLRLPARADGSRRRPELRSALTSSPSQASSRPPFVGLWWGQTALVEFIADFLFAAEWALGLRLRLDFLCDWAVPKARPVSQPPLESLPVLAGALLKDHARCLALLAAPPTEPLSAQQRSDLVYLHQRMAWMLRTCWT